MKFRRIKRLSKKNGILSLIVTGLIIIGVGYFISAQIFEKNIEVYEPEVVSNYQPDDKEETQNQAEENEEENDEKPEEANPDPEPVEESQWPVVYSQAEASSLTVVVNKKHKLPSTYAPNLKTVSGAQLRPEAADALGAMLEAASNQGNSMTVLSSYRSYSTQVNTYNGWVQRSGQEAADTFSARPGHSEHQLGLAVDLGDQNVPSCNLEECFGDTQSGKWLENNAHKYGFIIRYPEGKQAITGFIYEPWHLRYVGVEAATNIKNSGLTMDQYYGVEAGGYQ